MDAIVSIRQVSHTYDQRPALDVVSLEIAAGEIFGFLGPNGSGKTTLFRILSTLMTPQAGSVAYQFDGVSLDLLRDRDAIRRGLGVVFQSPSLDKQLTAEENLRYHGRLYGLGGAELNSRIDTVLQRFGLTERRREYVGGFSGGMRRRVELAKGLLNRPRLLLLDEPSTGLDPTARIDLWRFLEEIRRQDQVTILLTTHLMDEADRCGRLAIMDRGKVAACDTPAALKDRIGGDIITLTTADPAGLQKSLGERLSLDIAPVDGTFRIERAAGHAFIPELVEALPGLLTSVSLSKPSLEDVFIDVTGRKFQDDIPAHG